MKFENWKKIFPKRGRYFETDNGILYCGDSLDILSLFPNECADFIFSDYPFKIKGRDYISFVSDLSKEYYRILKTNCVLLIINNPYNLWKTKNAYDKFKHRDSIVLIRKGSLRCAYHFGFHHNYLMTFVKGNDIKYKWNGTRKNHDKEFLLDVIEYQNGYRGKGNIFHSEALPINLVETMIKLFTNEKDLVIDPFLGSGTTAIVCEKLNRRWIGIEIQKKYCNLIKQRLENYSLFNRKIK